MGTEVDDKGVPLENRIREMERKLQEKYDKELSDTRREIQELKSAREQDSDPPKPAGNDAAQERLMEFVKDPDGFVISRAAKLREESELSNVRPWLESQPGYSKEHGERIQALERKLLSPSPMERARAYWDVIQSEEKAKKAVSMTDEERRQESVGRGTTEGSGKSVDKKQGPTRADLIKKLGEASAEGDLEAEILLTGLLEDVR